MRELDAMFTAHQEFAWDHTAMLLAALSHKSISPQRLNPYRKSTASRPKMRPVELYALAASLKARNEQLLGE